MTMRMKGWIAVTALAAALAGCAGQQESSPRQEESGSADTTRGSGIDTGAARPVGDSSDAAPLSTVTLVTLERSGEGYMARFPYTFTNRFGAPIYLVNCNGDISPSLQRRVGEAWEDWWIPMMNGCLSPPVVVKAGGTLSDSAWVGIRPDDGRYYSELIAGGDSTLYRLVWHQALASFDAAARPFGPTVPLEHRVSNAFRLELR
jgi:hypothetical protein